MKGNTRMDKKQKEQGTVIDMKTGEVVPPKSTPDITAPIQPPSAPEQQPITGDMLKSAFDYLYNITSRIQGDRIEHMKIEKSFIILKKVLEGKN